jgi:hypothetical protein
MKGVVHVDRDGVLKRMEINHEETKSTKKNQKNLRALRFFVVDFRRRIENEEDELYPLDDKD